MPFPDASSRLFPILLPPGEDFAEATAAVVLDRWRYLLPDLSGCRVLAPSLPLAAALRGALARGAGVPLLLPRFDTLHGWAAATPPPGGGGLPDSERLVLLHEALKERGWFDEKALWGIAAEMAELFDEMTARAVGLPADEATLAAQFEAAYRLRASQPLAFEARVVHELWRALASVGRPDGAATYGVRLARLAEAAEGPLCVVLDRPPEESLLPAERAFLERYAARQPMTVIAPSPRHASVAPIGRLLAATWPDVADAAPLRERAGTIRDALPASPLAGRLELLPAAGREREAQTAAGKVVQWLAEGRRRIALVAQDRLTARRVRALLERDHILVADETGWKLSTSRAAAAVDALLEVAAGGAYHRDLLDLLKSPFVLADLDVPGRNAAVFALEAAIRRGDARCGLARFRRAVADHPPADPGVAALIAVLLDRVGVATVLLGSRSAPLARWLERLDKALEALAAIPALAADAAGAALLALVAERRRELAGNPAVFGFAAFRDWLNRQLEAATFRDRGIVSPVVITHLAAARLRPFEAALLLGGDAGQLAPPAGGTFFNQAVRKELGLSTRDEGQRGLRRDLELLLATAPRVAVTWQAERDGEHNLLAPDLDLLSTLHRLAWGDDLRRPLPARRKLSGPDPETAPTPARQATALVPGDRLPRRLSVSAYQSLVDCPYRFFARHVLRLGELDEVQEEMDKSEYGALVHRTLERFHARVPTLAGVSDGEATAILSAIVAEVFTAAVEENWLALGWRLRWEARLAAYVAWQREREAGGWRWHGAELAESRRLDLPGGGSVEVHGRIDRVDAGPDGIALLDYKTQAAKRVRDKLAGDVQLATYALIHGEAVAEAAYVALDDRRVEAVAAADDIQAAASAQGQRLVGTLAAIGAGSPLPAHGAGRICAWCEMAGLCRRDHV